MKHLICNIISITLLSGLISSFLLHRNEENLDFILHESDEIPELKDDQIIVQGKTYRLLCSKTRFNSIWKHCLLHSSRDVCLNRLSKLKLMEELTSDEDLFDLNDLDGFEDPDFVPKFNITDKVFYYQRTGYYIICKVKQFEELWRLCYFTFSDIKTCLNRLMKENIIYEYFSGYSFSGKGYHGHEQFLTFPHDVYTLKAVAGVFHYKKANGDQFPAVNRPHRCFNKA